MANKRDRERREMADTDEWLGGQSASGGWLCLKFPARANRFQPKNPGTYILDIAPFKATKAHPNTAVHGKYVPDVMYQCHRMVGPNKDTVLCPGRTYNRKCFVCEYRAKIGAGPDKEPEVVKALKDLMPKDRQIWNIFNHDEKEKGWQPFEYSFHLFGKNIAEKIQMSRAADRDRYKTYWHPGEKGMTLKILAKEESGPNGSKFLDFSQVEFVPRTDKVLARLDKAGEPWTLDTILRETPYDQVKRMFLAIGGGDDEDEEDAGDTDTEDEDLDDDEEADEDDDGDDEEDDADPADDEDDEDEDADDEDEDEEEVTPPAFKGDRVKFRSKGGDKLSGKVVAVLAEEQKLKVKDEDGDVHRVPFGKVIAAKEKADAKRKGRRSDPF